MDGLLPGLAGNADIHPMFVHFPIALWPTALAFYAFGVFKDHEGARQAGRWMLYAGTAAAAVAIATGFLAADRLGHDSVGHDAVHVHRNFMIAAALVAAGAAGGAKLAVARASKRLQIVAVIVLSAAVGVATLGADRGAHLVFGMGVGVSTEPPPAAKPAHDHGGHHH
jgi:uncharacterized membrane protein